MVERVLAGVDAGIFAVSRKPFAERALPVNLAKNEIKDFFGFDYERLVEKRLRYWNSFPEGHKLNFFNIAERHEGSGALYLAEEIVGRNWVFVQVIPPDVYTTRHKHKKDIPEIHDSLRGESIVIDDGIKYVLREGKPRIVFGDRSHQSQGGEQASLNLIILQNSAHIPRSELHIPVV